MWGVDVDGAFCLLCCPTADGHWPGMQSLGFGKVLSCFVVELFFGRVADLTGPHTMIVRLGHRALGPMLIGLITPCGAVPSSNHPYPRVCKLLRWFALLWWRRFES
jgi:hypothetical protein